MRALLLVPLLFACSKLPAGEPCSASGDGFTRYDPCSYTCVEWEIPCADGSSVVPGVCSGRACTTDAECQDGFSCAATGSVAKSCLPDDTCASGFSEDRPESWSASAPGASGAAVAQ
jgi:hypothetical protein